MWKFTGVVPLVCDQIWASVLAGYPEPKLKILVNQNVPEVKVHVDSCLTGQATWRQIEVLSEQSKYPCFKVCLGTLILSNV